MTKSLVLTISAVFLLLVGLAIYKHQRDASFVTTVDHPAESPDPTPTIGGTATNVDASFQKVAFSAFKWDNGCNAGRKDPRLPLKVASGTHVMIFHNEGAMSMATSGQDVWKCGKNLYVAF